MESFGSSPAQRMMTRRTKTCIPTAATLPYFPVEEEVESKIQQKTKKAKQSFAIIRNLARYQGRSSAEKKELTNWVSCRSVVW